MISVLMLSFLFGAVLGQRFNVLVMLPATIVVLVLFAGAGIVRPLAAWDIVKAAGMAAILLQGGYFTGLILRHILSEAPEPSTAAPSADTSTHHAAR